MIVGIDVSSVAYGTGVSNYTLNLVKHLVKNDRKNTYKLFFSSLRQPLPVDIRLLKKFSNVRVYHYRLPPTFLEILWNRVHFLPIEIFIGDCDIFHTSDWTQPPTIKAKTIATIHDLTPFLNPQWLPPVIVKAHRRKMFWAVQKCYAFVCVSQNTKNDLTRLFPLIKQPVYVIPEAAEDKYGRYRKLSKKIKLQKQQILQKQYGLTRYVLAQGTREPRKNLDRLIQAFIKFRQKYPKSKTELAISGKYGWGQDVLVRPQSYIKVLGYIPEKDMAALHANALCLAYPSLYEGFGLPLVKSMEVGVPVITSNVSSLPEVVGSAGILVDPLSVENIEIAIEKIVTSLSLRTKLSKLSLKQAQKFSWDRTAIETLAVYKSLL